MKNILVIIFSLLFATVTFAQKRKIEILHSDKMVGDKSVRKLYGEVVFKHKSTMMYCDSAYFYPKDNLFEAYSNVRIIDKEVTITADSLYYNSQTSFAKLRGKVVLKDNTMNLRTAYLDYDLKQRIGYYYNKGVITNQDNKLSSYIGTYYSEDNEFFFKRKVVITNPEYTIKTDTLRYNTVTEVSKFYGPTTIVSDENTLYTENGWYDSKNEKAQFYKNSSINSGEQIISGDNLYYDRNTDYGKAKGNVLIQDTTEKIDLYCDFGEYFGKEERVFVCGNITMQQKFQDDTLFLSSDTIYMKKLLNPADSTEYTFLQSYHKVRFFMLDIQGVADSLVYNSKDSVINLYTKPILWSDKSQITGNQITLTLENSVISGLEIDDKSFIISQDDTVRFNQIKGVSLKGFIKDGELYKVDIKSKGQTIYYLRDNDELIGVNKATCDDITVFIENGEPVKIIFNKKPSGTLYPPQEVTATDSKLDNFNWYNSVRPKHKKDIHTWIEY